MMRIAGLVAALASAAPLAAATPQPAAAYSDRLAHLSPIQRFAALRSAIGESGEYCKRVEGATLRGRYKNLIMWSVTCDRGVSYGLFIGPDASVQVRSCADLTKLGLPQCARSRP